VRKESDKSFEDHMDLPWDYSMTMWTASRGPTRGFAPCSRCVYHDSHEPKRVISSAVLRVKVVLGITAE
jgi:hypothetical protein